MNQDKILLEEPASKRSRHQREEDEFLEPSDEEVLGYSESSSGAEDDEDVDVEHDGVMSEEQDASDDEVERDDEMAGWGRSKSAYYHADKITTEEEALAEEEEARRLQQKQLKSLNEADFGFDELEWAASADRGAEEDERHDEWGGGVVKEKLPQLQITPDMTDAHKLKMLRRRYPDLEGFAKELVDLQPVWLELKEDADALHTWTHTTGNTASLREPASRTQFRALSAYLGALAMYFAILISPARDAPNMNDSIPLPLSPYELREHDVMEYIRECRDIWESVIDLEDDRSEVHALSPADDDQGFEFNGFEDSTFMDAHGHVQPNTETLNRRKSKSRAQEEEAHKTQATASAARRAARIAHTEASLKALSASLAKPAKLPRSTRTTTAPVGSGDHDLADEAPLDTHTAAEKARQRKSLRFYTSRIAQKANKDARFAEATGGDDDVPYRERWRDRMERLNREAEARGRKGRGDDELGVDDEEEDEGEETTNGEREAVNGEDEDYAELMGQARAKKDKKRQREAAYREAQEQGKRIERVAADEVGPDGRREIGYAIAKNKGLTPKRNKQSKNPRVKQRKRAEKKTKKLKSMKPTFSGGEGKSGYQGELTGVKTGLVRGVKF